MQLASGITFKMMLFYCVTTCNFSFLYPSARLLYIHFYISNRIYSKVTFWWLDLFCLTGSNCGSICVCEFVILYHTGETKLLVQTFVLNLAVSVKNFYSLFIIIIIISARCCPLLNIGLSVTSPMPPAPNDFPQS